VYSNLIAIRKSLNLTGEEVAKLIGVNKATYSKKENGTIKFSLT
jgi:transcriptional regulator with XRE-family HTH domain